MTVKTEVLETLLCPLTAISFVSDAGYGAIDTFIGTVRNRHEEKDVTGITYDAHPLLTVKSFQKICVEATERWPQTRYYVAHYQGELAVGGMSIIIAVGSPHRAESFEACRYVIEEIKKRSPVWKKEHYVEGQSEWLPGHCLSAEGGSNIDMREGRVS